MYVYFFYHVLVHRRMSAYARVGVHGFFNPKKNDMLIKIIVACKSGENVLHVDTT